MFAFQNLARIILLAAIVTTPAGAWATLTPGQADSLRQQAASNPEALQQLRSAAMAGDAHAQFSLGVMYDNGQGVTKDDAQAVQWYRKAAEQGHAGAQYNFGLMYANGRGVAKDYAQAVQWYRKAAEQGNASAQNNLGVMYANGRGVPRDVVAAYVLYSLSTSIDSSPNNNAANNRKALAEIMSTAQIEAGQALTRRMAAGVIAALDQYLAGAKKRATK